VFPHQVVSDAPVIQPFIYTELTAAATTLFNQISCGALCYMHSTVCSFFVISKAETKCLLGNMINAAETITVEQVENLVANVNDRK
jgi:hypothetical protein